MRGTEERMMLRICYATSSTELGYGAASGGVWQQRKALRSATRSSRCCARYLEDPTPNTLGPRL
eukprot:353989-Rhodomonas_salina.5